ncbi:hypothetical protein H0H81_002150 [Sphagnurus paluster]|uniref:Uncharacterized protein n=1 Tax=Sphagnurus paluster TaxID=117069 RepID=A0A9P7GJP4_9AGAR|nr:hypothetical protein H0H81_002150 [Sphagnurus paluster]
MGCTWEFGNTVTNTVPLPLDPFQGTPPPGRHSIEHLNSPHFAAQPNSALTQYISKASADAGLNNLNQTKAYKFGEINQIDKKLAVSYVESLCNSQRLDKMATTLSRTQKQLTNILDLVQKAWELSAAQEKALRALLYHQMISPTTSYHNIVAKSLAWISTHRSQFHLTKFATNDLIKATIHSFLKDKEHKVKSKYRKLVFRLTLKCLPLETLADLIVDEFRAVPKPAAIGNNILATIALHRSVAAPLAGKKNVKGGNTGFWKILETELLNISTRIGTDRNSPAWKEWEETCIAKDRAAYPQDLLAPLILTEVGEDEGVEEDKGPELHNEEEEEEEEEETEEADEAG